MQKILTPKKSQNPKGGEMETRAARGTPQLAYHAATMGLQCPCSPSGYPKPTVGLPGAYLGLPWPCLGHTLGLPWGCQHTQHTHHIQHIQPNTTFSPLSQSRSPKSFPPGHTTTPATAHTVTHTHAHMTYTYIQHRPPWLL